MSKYNLNTLTKRIKKYKVEYILFILVGLSMESFIRYSALSYKKEEEKNYTPLRRYLYNKVNGCFLKSDNSFLQKISHFVKGENYMIQLSCSKA